LVGGFAGVGCVAGLDRFLCCRQRSSHVQELIGRQWVLRCEPIVE
jgi:hypothetical protein